MAESASTGAAVDNKPPLDDLMLAMDVVDTLRHRASLVERELNSEARDQQLIERLREIYRAQGIPVPDNVLAEGVEALKEDRFRYTPPEPGMWVNLAKAYVHRNRWLTPLLVMLALAGVACLAYMLLVTAPRRRLLAELPARISAQLQSIVELSHVDAATEQAKQLATRAQNALDDGDVSGAQKGLEELNALRSSLEEEYELRIVTEGSTGVWRIPDINESARNYYIIVQPVTKDGKVLTLPVTSEEDGKIRSASRWGLRVDEETFNKVAADKKDDGIIQQNKFGAKRAGYLDPEYVMPTTGGAITSW